ncbi:response regulator [Psychrobacter aquaticus]|uniref:histidine kinase n=1 Tax=Psychrobacter aquaticus CMS 56 TaxID=1354303 RepID=U4T6I7_9GAMM|nr:response regulator [Psychrobacter aquaticus]ERL56525.1 PAS/PAC sensor hybrid histidine kinase [Psychrobacter aquaticus CMS 56]
MQQFQSLQRLLLFYTLTLLAMLALYYSTLFYEIKNHSEQHSIYTFRLLQHDVIKQASLLNSDIKKILKDPAFEEVSYQLIFMTPSGQTYIHRHTRPNETAFATVTFPTIDSPNSNNSSRGAYTINNYHLTGTIRVKDGHKIHLMLRHQPLDIDWISYRYWLPLMTAIIFFIITLLYMLNRRLNWEQLLIYTDNLSSHAKEAYTPPPFVHKNSTTEFLRLGHALSRAGYQLHSDYRRIKTLTHRLERLVNQAPLPMLMIMRHGQISFFNRSFERIFISSSELDNNHELTDFIAGKDESTQLILQTLSSLRVTRTLTVYGLTNQHSYHLHVTPWFGEHGQIHGFTVLLNPINEFINQIEQLQQQNQQLQRKLDQLNTFRSRIGRQLRVPLEAIIDTLEPINPQTPPEERNDALKTLIKSSQSMLATLNDELDIGEIEVRKTRLNIAPVDIYQLGQDVSNLIINNTRQQGLELNYFFVPDSPRCIDTDDLRLRQILVNLLKNAIKFTVSGCVSLTIDRVTQAQIIQISSDSLLPVVGNAHKNKGKEPSPHWLRFSIKDTGIGMTADKQRQLLADFDQNISQNNKIDQKTIATGVGLNNANSFAQLLGGFIELQSSIGEGSTFTLYLPCRQPKYQSVYHRNTHLTRIHLIAIVNQPLVAKNLQRLCEHLSLSTTIHTSVDRTTIQQLTNQWAQTKQTLAPILLLDYEYYETISAASSNRAVTDDTSWRDQETEKAKSTNAPFLERQLRTVDSILRNTDGQQALHTLLTHPRLPKILFSMKPERRIPSNVLDKHEGFLNKPLDATLLLSELLRLTLPARQALTQLTNPPINVENNSGQLVPKDIAEPVSDTLLPLILVVEDSPTNQKIACKILSKLGYRSGTAADGQQALEQLKSQRQDISLILMDCRMPVMDGLQATQAIRAQGDDIPIVALTANNTEEDRDACIQVGMNDFLSKPINIKELEAVLQKFITQ